MNLVGSGMRQCKRSGGEFAQCPLHPRFAPIATQHFQVGHKWALGKSPCRAPATRGWETMSRKWCGYEGSASAFRAAWTGLGAAVAAEIRIWSSKED